MHKYNEKAIEDALAKAATASEEADGQSIGSNVSFACCFYDSPLLNVAKQALTNIQKHTPKSYIAHLFGAQIFKTVEV